jgi:hypothetical protein
MTAHIPGPWRIAENEWNAKPHDPWTDAIKIEGDINANWAVPPLVCVTYRGGHNEANARLIAAAPDLLEVCKELYRCLFEEIDPDLAKKARAAIAKASKPESQ